jgi:hypothetical protein
LLVGAVAVAAIAAGIFVGQQSRASIAERALHVISGQPLRLVMIDTHASDVVVDLERGTEVDAPHVVIEWFDPKTGTRRVRDTIGGVALSDRRVGDDVREAAPETLVANFPLLYRTELAHRSASVVSARVSGTPAYWLRFPSGRSLSAVAIDRRTYHPLLVVFHTGGGRTMFRVQSVTHLDARSASPFAPRPIMRLPQAPVALTEPTSDLPPSIAAIRRIPGMPRGRVAVVRAKRLRFADGKTATDTVLANAPTQGRLPSHFLRLQLAAFATPSFGWTPALVALAKPNRLILEQAGAYTLGYLHLPRAFVRLSTTQGRQAIIAAGRQLRSRS